MKTILLSVSFIIAAGTLVSFFPSTTVATNDVGTINEYCVHARETAIDLKSEGIPTHYGGDLEKLCGSI